MVKLEDLDIPYPDPSEKAYNNVIKLAYFLVERVLKDSLEFYGSENLEEQHYQIFLANHKFYTDPILLQVAIAISSDNGNPIPAPAYKSYIKHPALGPIMTKLYSYPIYGKEDGYKIKEKSMQYSVESFVKQKRILVFPEGRISHDGLLSLGRIGSSEIAWRAYHDMNYDKDGKPESQKKKIKIIPTEISYSPIGGIPLKDMDEMTIRFGKSIDFEEEVIKQYNSIKYKFHKDKKKVKRNLQIKLMRKVMKEIGLLTTLNIDNLGSRVLYDFAEKKRDVMKIDHFHEMIQNMANNLKESENFYMLNHLKNPMMLRTRTEDFLDRCRKKGALNNNEIYSDLIHLNLDYILKEHDFFDVRNDNIIKYNYNLLEHLTPAKKIINKELKNIRRR
ncbi:MAG: 1-acyl-sn-glycerol-3-phosphate acyltransferase [Nanoarchaeota archaeon]|nr:1-acyl-sn-glycerol-3-phosphate acyltransferase [Nanoarchaeota archaeon]